MPINIESIADDPAQLKAALTKALSDLSTRDAELAELRLLVDYLQKQRFRKSSESYIGMKSFFDDSKSDSADPESEPAKARTPRAESGTKPVRKPLPDSIDREVVRHELPESDRHCACCGGDLHEIGAEISEQLDIVPATVKVIRHERVKYGCRGCETGVTTAPMPKQPIPKSLASPATLAHIAVAKYADHLPLYRQEELWDRLGVTLDRGTMASWMIRCGELVRPIINLMRDDIVRDGVVHCDESPIRVLDKKRSGKKSSHGYMWVLSRAGPGPEAHIFTYDPTRSGKVAAELLSDFKGVVVTDGYGAYKQLSKNGMIRAGCWAHIRREFFKVIEQEEDPSRQSVGHQMLRQIARLYRIERSVAGMDDEKRLAIRQRISRRIMARIESNLNHWIGVAPARTATGKALAYMRNEWPALQVFLHDPMAPIDNNRVENVIRPMALGKKNWLFAATTAGADASGNLYSLIQTAIVNDLEPQAYLARVFADLPNAVTADDVAKLLPYPDQH